MPRPMPVPTVAPSAVLGGGLVIGLVLGRAWGRRRQPPPVAPELLEQRLRLLELEAEQTSAEVPRLLAAPEFMHELRRPRVRRSAA